MPNFDTWALSKHFNIAQIACLLLGYSPDNVKLSTFHNDYFNIDGFDSIINALKYAIISNELLVEYYLEVKAENEVVKKILQAQDSYNKQSTEYPPMEFFDWDKTMVEDSKIKEWLRTRKITDNYFFFREINNDDFMNPRHPYYSSKLAAAIIAWKEIANTPQLLNGKTPKSAITNFLTENAQKLGLTLPNANVNNSAVEDISKVVNWKPEGGAAPTPQSTDFNDPIGLPPKVELKKLPSKRDERARQLAQMMVPGRH